MLKFFEILKFFFEILKIFWNFENFLKFWKFFEIFFEIGFFFPLNILLVELPRTRLPEMLFSNGFAALPRFNHR